jgi:hypothetical protein
VDVLGGVVYEVHIRSRGHFIWFHVRCRVVQARPSKDIEL